MHIRFALSKSILVEHNMIYMSSTRQFKANFEYQLYRYSRVFLACTVFLLTSCNETKYLSIFLLS